MNFFICKYHLFISTSTVYKDGGKDSLWKYAMPEAEEIGSKAGQSPAEFEADMQDGDGMWFGNVGW